MNPILKEINERLQDISHYDNLLDLLKGELYEHLKKNLYYELKKESADVASKRIVCLNIFERIVNKLSRSYVISPERVSDIDLNEYINDINLNQVMSKAEKLLNTHNCFALEPYIDEAGKYKVRVLNATEFSVLGLNEQDPMLMTHFVKYMGSEEYDESVVNIYQIFTNEFITMMDSNGRIISQDINILGTIPFIYANKSLFEIQPCPDIDSYKNTMVINSLLTDLNYGTKFQSHSIMYGIDIDSSKLDASPDAFWALRSVEGNDKKPSIGVLSPTVDVDKVLSLISYTMSSWLECKGIKVSTNSNLTTNAQSSGVSKLIDESDASALIQENQQFLISVERQLWSLIAKIHNQYQSVTIYSKGLPLDLNVTVVLKHPTTTLTADEDRQSLQFKLDNGLISKKRALKQANPELSDQELEALQAEIDSENIHVTSPQQPISTK
jgi:Phage portal protein, SPP1 Gp6-like